MELYRIESLIEKYFDAETSIAEENELRNYFSSSDVAQHLEHYKPMFGYFNQARQEKSVKNIPLQTTKRKVEWMSIAASIAVLLGVGTFAWVNNQERDLGTYDNPEIALRETQKALEMLSGNVNKGIESMKYVGEYEAAKDQVFTVQ
jgi:hypothetical protein